jgi:uncharacterized membrane protein
MDGVAVARLHGPMLVHRIRRALRYSLWLIPLLCVLAGALLVLLTIAADRAAGYRLVPESVTGTPASVETILSTLATAMASLTTLVLTVTLVAIQLAMNQFSPRIVSALLTDRFSQFAIGLFGATFLIAVLALREVDSSGGTVPGLSVLLAYLLMLASIVVLILFVHHAGQGLRVAGLIDLVGDRTRALIAQTFSADPPLAVDSTADPDVIVTRRPGNLLWLNRGALVALARRADCVLEVVPLIGDFVVGGMPLFRVHPGLRPSVDDDRPAARLDPDRLARLVMLGRERVHVEDLAWGLRKLVDIAERSIAQPFNDPTTTVQAMHRLHDLLRQLAVAPLAPCEYRDQDGVVRLVERTLTWDGFVRLAFDEIRLAGATTPQVPRRLFAALLDLKSVAAPERQAPLDRQIRLLTAAVRRSYADDEDISAALTPDIEGIGSGPDLVTAVRLPAAVVDNGEAIDTERVR